MARPRKGKELTRKQRHVLFPDDPGDRQGRPTIFRMWMIEELEKFDTSEKPGTVAQLAKFFGVSVSTLSDWMADYVEFREAVLNLRRRADDQVVSSLFKRANGYSIPNVTVKREAVRVKTSDITGIGLDDGEEDFIVGGEKVVVTEAKTHFAPETAAMKLWLVNRDPAAWSDKSVVQLEGNMPWGELLKRVDEAMIEDAEYTDLTEDDENDA